MKGIISSAIGMLALACSATSAQAAISSYVVTGATVSKSTGAVTVTGTIVCTAGHGFVITNNLFQFKGPHLPVANGHVIGVCSGGTDPWTAPDSTLIGTVGPGNASVLVSAVDETDVTFAPVTTTKVSVHPVP